MHGNMGKRSSVLIVESRQNIRTFLEMTLNQEGVRVFSAVNLSSALLQLRVLQPDLIIIGLDQLELDVDAAVAQIKALSSAPLLALGDGAGVTPVQGISDTLHYPLIAGQFCAKVATLLGGSYLPTHDGSRGGGFDW